MTAVIAAHAPDRRFVAWALAWAAASLVAFGLVSAIIPNPVFGRQIPPEPFAIAVWLASAPLVGVIGATYSSPLRRTGTLRPMGPAAGTVAPTHGTVDPVPPGDPGAERTSSRLGALAGVGAFLAIGCPVCNKLVLVALGTSGAMSIWAPLQPLVGAASLVLLAGTAAWRLRIRRRGGSCAV